MRRVSLVLAVLLSVLLTACSGNTDTTEPTANRSGLTTPGTTEATTAQPSAPSSATPSASPMGDATDGTLTVSAWDLTFTLPDAIPAGDVTLLDHTGDGFVDLRSATLEEALDTEACGGSSVQQGQFAQIARADDESADADGNVAVGGYVYRVQVNTFLDRCYPDDLVQRYLTEDVAAAIRKSLTAS